MYNRKSVLQTCLKGVKYSLGKEGLTKRLLSCIMGKERYHLLTLLDSAAQNEAFFFFNESLVSQTDLLSTNAKNALLCRCIDEQWRLAVNSLNYNWKLIL